MGGNDIKNRFTLAVHFRVAGFASFLSHQETSRMFKRALVRGDVELRYSEGFNPHPKMSLPLPRSVGMASDCELLLIGILSDQQTPCADHYASILSKQLPADISIVKVEVCADTAKFIVDKVTYFIPVLFEQGDAFDNAVRIRDEFNAGKPLEVERVSHKTGKRKLVNLCDFVEAVSVGDDGIELVTKLVDGTSIRLDEMPAVFGLCGDDLNGPIVRRAIEWDRK